MPVIKLIGVGGIGTCLLTFLPRYLAYEIKKPPRFVLVDGDNFQAGNVFRQDFTEQGNKAEVKARELIKRFPHFSVSAIPEFVTAENIKSIVRRGDVVLLAVDNHATRLLVSQRCQQLHDITLISAGNDLETGSCQVYIRKRGVELFHPIEAFHPEIQTPQDANPGENPDCFQMASAGEPQIVITNMAAALGMATTLYQILAGKQPAGEVYFDIRAGEFLARERRKVDASNR